MTFDLDLSNFDLSNFLLLVGCKINIFCIFDLDLDIGDLDIDLSDINLDLLPLILILG